MKSLTEWNEIVKRDYRLRAKKKNICIINKKKIKMYQDELSIQ